MSQIIQWFPGHMAKAFRLMRENLKHVDIVFELVDARIPLSSRNPELDDVLGDKPRLLIMTKTDLADPERTSIWRSYFESQGLTVVSLDTRGHKTPQIITKAARVVLADKWQNLEEKGVQDKAIRALVAGIPNVGKSTLLNHLVTKNVAITGDRPGVTKKLQWLKTPTNLELLDTPGVLWPKFVDQRVGQHLAMTGAIKDQLINLDDIALAALKFFRDYNAEAITTRYHLNSSIWEEKSDVDILLTITEKLGFKDDYDRASERLLIDLRRGKLGRYTLELPSDHIGEVVDD
ncbi:ribosome biogenesis GTPase YlqF [Weissella paramesenteroides]|jgi:ribosome biogenesis GTPase A|uniref:Ribosome biogenesis GTPase A n=1 Tax=Weissella paramesenteroides ATCC 33313 TaxID=585506 RepID=C5RBD4_WEIPA|nr:ribosome biogenesis GTPase YlqF [Weissella paramesenteroides]ATF41057.1 ribosome biogenesis GTPase YlqF [Weissella paramesenteroides]EER74491.1 ribosome biogenesis GTP-binding protein YlqF [Weissella paramesenteroides ATCC 33313]KAA8440843.1 ribosome biogenesis GTPase YlqF [Weissella paramesenteroides]KAA8441803.1 ribosome biogenesis GTPase YlqF [Weissella paramesenteroides]KAA8443274.1 ribosome biogenesis GTPase YlqF [Weissella paramesenteroides]